MDLIERASGSGLLNADEARRALGGRDATVENLVARGVRCSRCGRPVGRDGRALACPPCGLRVEGGPRYEKRRLLGRGGMGDVWLGTDHDLSRDVALKYLRSAREDDLPRFRREARLAARLRHPGIVAVHDVVEDPDAPFLVMDYIDGVAADALPLTPREAVELARQAAEAVHYAHGQGVVHRDLKPGNILVRDGRAYVTDFGLAKQIGVDSSLSLTGEVFGTPAFMPPEQARGELRAVGTRSDVYALGASLYAMIAGAPPYRGTDAYQILRQVVEDDPPPLRRLKAGVGRDIEVIVQKAMAKEASRRYGSAAELALDLQRALDGEPIVARPPTVGYAIRRALGRHRRVLLVGAAGALATAVVLIVMLAMLRREREAALREMNEVVRTNLRAALLVRRAGDPKATEQFLPDLEAACRRAMERVPDSPEPHYHLGRMYRAMQRPDDALIEQERALRKDPRYAPSVYERAVLLALSAHDRRNHAERAWLARQGGFLSATGGFGGAENRTPTDAELAAFDPEWAAMRTRLKADLETLASMPGIDLDGVRGLTAAYDGRYAEARRLLEPIVESDPAREEAVVALLGALMALREYEAAERWALRACDADRGCVAFRLDLFTVYSTWGYALSSAGQEAMVPFEKAIAAATAALELVPEEPNHYIDRSRVHANVGLYHRRRGADPSESYRAALADLDAALARAKDRGLATVERARLLLNWGYFDWTKGVDPTPRFEAALADLEAAPANEDALSIRAKTYINLAAYRRDHGGDWVPLFEEAARTYEALLALNPRSAGAFVGRADARMNMASGGVDPERLFTASIEDYASALALESRNPETHMRRGSTYYNWALFRRAHGLGAEDLFESAAADFEAALALRAGFEEALTRLSLTLMEWARVREGRGEDPRALFEKALMILGGAIEANPASDEPFMRRAMIRIAWGESLMNRGLDPARQFEEALEDFEEADRRRPGTAETYVIRATARVNWAVWEMRNGRDPAAILERAIADYDAALAIHNRYVDAWRGRGQAGFNRGASAINRGGDGTEHLRRAEQDYGEALRIAPQDAATLWRRGRCRVLLGNAAGADADFRRAAEIDPTSVPTFEEDWKRVRAEDF